MDTFVLCIFNNYTRNCLKDKDIKSLLVGWGTKQKQSTPTIPTQFPKKTKNVKLRFGNIV